MQLPNRCFLVVYEELKTEVWRITCLALRIFLNHNDIHEPSRLTLNHSRIWMYNSHKSRRARHAVHQTRQSPDLRKPPWGCVLNCFHAQDSENHWLGSLRILSDSILKDSLAATFCAFATICTAFAAFFGNTATAENSKAGRKLSISMYFECDHLYIIVNTVYLTRLSKGPCPSSV